MSDAPEPPPIPMTADAVTAAGRQLARAERARRVRLLVPTAILATVPFAGFFVHASRHDQAVALVIMACWGMGCLLAATAALVHLKRPVDGEVTRGAPQALTLYVVAASFIGFWGTRAAYLELIAG